MKFLIRCANFTFLFVILIALVGCSSKDSVIVTQESPLSPLASPASSPLSAPEIKRFNIDKPLSSGAIEVTGSGPAGIPLYVVDITAGGKILGQGVIDSDGHFLIKLGKPLKERHIIGIRLADAKDPSTWTELWSMRGDGARAIPQIGDFFDSVITSN
jgi:hypothetical protein